MNRVFSEQPADAGARSIFDAQLAREIERSEQRRVAVLAVLFVGIFLFAGLAPVVVGQRPAVFALDLDGGHLRSWFLFLLGSLAAFEVTSWALLHYRRALFDGRCSWRRYVTAAVEISVPTALVLLLAQSRGSFAALTMPPVLLYFIFIILSALRLDLRLCLFTGAIAAAEYAAVVQILLTAVPDADPLLHSPMHLVGKPLLIFLAGVCAAYVTSEVRMQVARSLSAVEKQQRVLRLFGRHVSPAVVSRLVDGSLVGETRDVCILFLDVRGFTTYAEGKRPADVVSYLNTLFDVAVEVITRHGGTVNKFLGDGFMALFGAPCSEGNDSANAVRAAYEVRDAIARAVAAGEIPPTRISIGVHCGEVLTGLVGSAERQEYSVIGDVVNLAARVEALTRTVGAEILITDAVRVRAGDDVVGDAEGLGSVPIRGREKPVEVYRLAKAHDDREVQPAGDSGS